MTTEDDKPTTILDKAKDLAIDLKDKVAGFVGDNEEKIHGAVDKTGEFIDEKVTKGRFTEKIDKAQEATKNAVHKIADSGGPDDPGSEAAEPAEPEPEPEPES
jgi:ribosomal protein L15